MRWKTTLCFLLSLLASRTLISQCTPSGSPSCAGNITTIQGLTDCLDAGGMPNISQDLPPITCNYDLSGTTINLGKKVDIRFTGAVTVSSTTSFTASTGNATITVGSIVITANNGGGNGDLTFAELNAALALLPAPVTIDVVLAPLPVELSSFTAKSTSKGVSLDWSTATESNNKHFEVESSTDGKIFKQIGIVAGSGTSYTPQTYAFDHHLPAIGSNYYRLRQVDFDGAYEYSKMVTVSWKQQERARYRLFPNPVEQSFAIQTTTGETPTNVMLINTLGQEISLTTTTVQERFAVPSSLQKGTYIVRFDWAGETHFERIVIQ